MRRAAAALRLLPCPQGTAASARAPPSAPRMPPFLLASVRRGYCSPPITQKDGAAPAPPAGFAEKATPQHFTVKRDKYIKVIALGGTMRVSFAQMPNAALEALRRHGIAPEADEARALSEVMLSAVLLASFQGGEERVKIDYETDDRIFSVEATASGEIRGHIRESSEGNSRALCVSKVMYDQKKPIISVTPAATGNIIDDLREHILRSDGLDCAVWAAVNLPRGICVAVLAETIPMTAEATPHQPELYRRMERDLTKHAHFSDDIGHAGAAVCAVFGGDLTSVLQKTKLIHSRRGGGSEEGGAERQKQQAIVGTGVHKVDPNIDPVRVPIDFHCSCSLESFVNALAAMGSTALDSLRFEQPECPLRCENCGKTYAMNPDAWFKALSLTEAQERQ